MKNYRTEEQFFSITENVINGNWSDAAVQCVEFGFYANDLKKFNEVHEVITDLYDIAELCEMAQKLRNK